MAKPWPAWCCGVLGSSGCGCSTQDDTRGLLIRWVVVGSPRPATQCQAPQVVFLGQAVRVPPSDTEGSTSDVPVARLPAPQHCHLWSRRAKRCPGCRRRRSPWAKWSLGSAACVSSQSNVVVWLLRKMLALVTCDSAVTIPPIISPVCRACFQMFLTGNDFKAHPHQLRLS